MRIFLPVTSADLLALREQGHLEAPRPAHAATPGLQRLWPDADDEERDYAAMMAAAYDSLVLLAHDLGRGGSDPLRRAVVAADVPDRAVRAAGSDEVTAVVVAVPVELDAVHALHVDDVAAAADVRAAVAAVAAATAGDPAALGLVALEQHELLWYATQELGDLT